MSASKERGRLRHAVGRQAGRRFVHQVAGHRKDDLAQRSGAARRGRVAGAFRQVAAAARQHGAGGRRAGHHQIAAGRRPAHQPAWQLQVEAARQAGARVPADNQAERQAGKDGQGQQLAAAGPPGCGAQIAAGLVAVAGVVKAPGEEVVGHHLQIAVAIAIQLADRPALQAHSQKRVHVAQGIGARHQRLGRQVRVADVAVDVLHLPEGASRHGVAALALPAPAPFHEQSGLGQRIAAARSEMPGRFDQQARGGGRATRQAVGLRRGDQDLAAQVSQLRQRTGA